MGLIIDSPLKQIRRLGWLKRLEFIPLPVWITWQFIKTYKNQTFYCKWPSWFALYTPVKNWFRHMRQNISFLDIWCQYDIRTQPCWKKIGFTACRLRADLIGHGHHIGHKGRIYEKEIACRARPRIFSYNLSATFKSNISVSLIYAFHRCL